MRRLDPDRVAALLPRLYRAARAWCATREEAEDLVSEMLVRVLARPRWLRGEEELGYLLRALRNTLITQRRSAARRPRPAPLPDELAARPLSDPAESAALRELYAAIAELPEGFRDVLVAVDLVGLSYGEAARALDLREGTVTSRLYRARERLARRLEPAYPAS